MKKKVKAYEFVVGCDLFLAARVGYGLLYRRSL